MTRSRTLPGLAALLGAIVIATPAVAQERHALGAGHVAVYNIAGQVEVYGTAAGGQVVVEVVRGGRGADELRVESGRIGDVSALRVIYPSDRVVYSARRGGSTNLRVRSDGTWGGRRSGGTRNVRVSGSGSGLDAHANLRVGVPAGQRADIYLGVGTITAENVNGTVRLDTHSGGVTARRMSGSLIIDTGSGAVDLTGMDGDVTIDTGSGGVRATDVRGSRVLIDTGSGSVNAQNVSADNLRIDTGSGSVTLRGGSAREAVIDTGSGSVNAELSGALDRLVIDTGSGGVTLALPADASANLHVDTGSGGISVDFPVRISRQARGELRGTIGDGRGSIRIDTGSGGVRIRQL